MFLNIKGYEKIFTRTWQSWLPMGKKVKYLLFTVFFWGKECILMHEIKNKEMKQSRPERNESTWITTGEQHSQEQEP